MTGEPGRRRALGVGLALAAAYALAAGLSARLGAPPRPIYDGTCPTAICPPPSTAPYSPPPRPEPTPTPGGGPRPSSAPPRPGATPSPRANPSAAAGSPAPAGPPSVAPSPAPVAAGLVGPAGGTVASAGGEVAVTLPAGAVGEATAISLSAVTSDLPPPPGRVRSTAIWHLSATARGQPLTVFRRTLRIALRYPAAPPDLVCFWDGTAWEALPTTVDPAGRIATATSAHLSLFAAFGPAPAPLVPPKTGVPGGLILGAVGAAGALAVVAAALAVRRRGVPVQAAPSPAGPAALAGPASLAVLGLAALAAAGLGIAFNAARIGLRLDHRTPGAAALAFAVLGGLGAALAVASRLSRADLGLRRPVAIPSAAGAAVVVAALILPAVVLHPHPASPGPGAPLSAIALFGLFVAPAEELLFRGVLQGAATRLAGAPAGIAAGAAAFAIAHLPVYGPASLPLGLGAGLLLGWLRWWSRSLAAPTLAHAIADLALLFA